MIEVDLSVEPAWGDSKDWQGIAERGVAQALQTAAHAFLADSASLNSVSIRLADNAEVHRLNRDYRYKDMPTNVLSFPMLEPVEIEKLRKNIDVIGETLLGDIILAYETCAIEAAEKSIPLPDHVTHLIIHGMLHLLGHDHIEDIDAEIMEALEVKALASLGLGNPYSD